MVPYGIAPGQTVGLTVNIRDEMRKFLHIGPIDDVKRIKSTFGALKVTENPVEPWNSQVKYLRCPPQTVTCIQSYRSANRHWEFDITIAIGGKIHILNSQIEVA